MLKLIEDTILSARATVTVKSDQLQNFVGYWLMNLAQTDKARYDEFVYRNNFDTAIFECSPKRSIEVINNFLYYKSGGRPKFGALDPGSQGGIVKEYGNVALHLNHKMKEEITIAPYDSNIPTQDLNNDPAKIKATVGVKGNIFPMIAHAKTRQLEHIINGDENNC